MGGKKCWCQEKSLLLGIRGCELQGCRLPGFFLRTNERYTQRGLRSSMVEKKGESFTVTDRRLFTADGELRRESSEQEVPVVSKPGAVAEVPPAAPETAEPPSPTMAEQKEQADAYRQSSAEMDRQVEA